MIEYVEFIRKGKTWFGLSKTDAQITMVLDPGGIHHIARDEYNQEVIKLPEHEERIVQEMIGKASLARKAKDKETEKEQTHLIIDTLTHVKILNTIMG